MFPESNRSILDKCILSHHDLKEVLSSTSPVRTDSFKSSTARYLLQNVLFFLVSANFTILGSAENVNNVRLYFREFIQSWSGNWTFSVLSANV